MTGGLSAHFTSITNCRLAHIPLCRVDDFLSNVAGVVSIPRVRKLRGNILNAVRVDQFSAVAVSEIDGNFRLD